jgi:gluconokinase
VTPLVVVIMGVSGSGKSTVAALLADRLGVPFCEGDALHPPANIAKMAAGHPLDDADRAPWLDSVHAWMGEHRDGGVVSCSALKRRYRDRLREGLRPPPAFVLLDPPRAVLERRLAARHGHFMPADLIGSQLDTLERPLADEHALRLEGDEPPSIHVDEVLGWLAQDQKR